jgi:hypothetical protein
MTTPQDLALFASGIFFLVGLLCGVWKYAQMWQRPGALAHPYVDIAHRAALLYAFACLLLERMVERSRLPEGWQWAALSVQLTFFVLALLTYVIHGWLKDCENQLARPHRLGRWMVPRLAIFIFMISLIVGEIGGFVVLFYGAIAA